MSRFVWCEDSRSGFVFWKTLFNTLYPDITLDSKGNNSELRKSVENLGNNSDQYYIIMDLALDNPDVLREYKRLTKVISAKNNINLIKLHSFEYCLLSFKDLDDWIFAEEDELRDKRKNLMEARKLIVRIITEGASNDELIKLQTLLDVNDLKNSEQTASKILFELTRNTGFETDKSQIGPCFIVDCCNWKDKQNDDICGLNLSRLTLKEKMEQILKRSVLYSAFMEADLYDNCI
ncbi:hypothetical protein SAMN02910317_03038 [Ruminococcaceae bacterium FB2012]|nr:hypothetical protein SAMN02910317_03038 [Ruminococcaceae bacterium FB2012]